MNKFITCILFLSLISYKAYQYFPKKQTLKAHVSNIHDGDTLTAYLPSWHKKVKVRLLGIDCLEVYNPYSNKHALRQSKTFHLPIKEIYKKGKQAQKILEKIIKNNNNNISLVINKKHKFDYYHRVLAIVKIDRKNVNNMLLKTPFCFKYPINKRSSS